MPMITGPVTDEEQERVRKKLGLPKSDGVTYVDLDARKEPPEPVTAGWTDTQIRGKSREQLEAMIASGQKGVESLRETLTTEEQRINDLRRILDRHAELIN